MNNVVESQHEGLARINLESKSELRFKVGNEKRNDCYAVLEVKGGSLEIFGTELIIDNPYVFSPGVKAAVFTWQGCSLNLYWSKIISYYTTKDTPMDIYLKCHEELEIKRLSSERGNTRGPIVMVVGPQDESRIQLCRILLNYSTRFSFYRRKPIFVNLDPDQAQIAIPGTIGAIVVGKQAEVNGSFSEEDAIIFHFGSTNININRNLYNILVKKLAVAVHQQMNNRSSISLANYCSGIIINTSNDESFHHLIHAAETFQVNLVLVLDDNNLFHKLSDYKPKKFEIKNLPKSNGISTKSDWFRWKTRQSRIHRYFYGSSENARYPYSCEISFRKIKIYGIVGPLSLSTGIKRDILSKENLGILQPEPYMNHHLLALTSVEGIELSMVIRGFVCVLNVDTQRQKLTLLSPHWVQYSHHKTFFLSHLQFTTLMWQ